MTVNSYPYDQSIDLQGYKNESDINSSLAELLHK